VRRLTPLLLTCLFALPAFAEDASGHVLEFGLYGGYYDFDRQTDMKDRALFGLRAGVRLASWAVLDVEFDEVYTSRELSGNSARQLSMGLHLRAALMRSRLAPIALAGVSLVAFDDADDPDSYGDAYDIGLGLRFLANERWKLRAEWMLRSQPVRLYAQDPDSGELTPEGDETVALYSRSYRLSVAYVF